MRLACVKHAASVRSEPGSNSQVHLSTQPITTGPSTNRPELNQSPTQSKARNTSKRTVTHPKDTSTAPQKANQSSPSQNQPRPPANLTNPARTRIRAARAPPTYPFLASTIVKERSQIDQNPAIGRATDRLALIGANPAQTEELSHSAARMQEEPSVAAERGCRRARCPRSSPVPRSSAS